MRLITDEIVLKRAERLEVGRRMFVPNFRLISLA